MLLLHYLRRVGRYVYPVAIYVVDRLIHLVILRLLTGYVVRCDGVGYPLHTLITVILRTPFTAPQLRLTVNSPTFVGLPVTRCRIWLRCRFTVVTFVLLVIALPAGPICDLDPICWLVVMPVTLFGAGDLRYTTLFTFTPLLPGYVFIAMPLLVSIAGRCCC